eukprot:CAMPEP_0197030016 /NCGR_PEP_ID=MMETSP1384-20130603/9336_1 /TAXON_ID=29189 /ORGANISM="Ammonia sp." /LENGTH=184 /DNA_ID=CAMNT_0042459289 /DNA_START=965 /DNA_END=1519 /DNA_ORIENTATION=-
MSLMIVAFTAISIAFGFAIDFFDVEKLLRTVTGLESNYGLIGLVMLFNIYILMYLGMNVGRARKKYGVEYPTMYADVNHSKNRKNANIFNCVQRSHQNSLEQQATFLTVCALSAQKYPLVAGVAAFVVCLGRLAYAAGYSTGDPSKRYRGAFGYFGLLTLLGCSWIVCLEQLGLDVNVISKFIK